MYYNPSTKETLSEQDLKNLLNVSFPEGREQIGDWLLVHDDRPTPDKGYAAVKSEIRIVNGKAVQTYRAEKLDEPVQQESFENRIKEIEDAVDELKTEAAGDAALAQKISIVEGAIIDLAAMMANLQTYCINAVNELRGEKQ